MGCGNRSGCCVVVDDCPEAGDLSCHLVVDFWTIEADGCPEAGDLGCQSGVNLSIGVGGRPEAKDFCCH